MNIIIEIYLAWQLNKNVKLLIKTQTIFNQAYYHNTILIFNS